jgi:hypothetical protein
MNQLLAMHTFDQSFNATLLTAFATLSLLLAVVGLFGVMSYIVAKRTTKIGAGLVQIASFRPALPISSKDLAEPQRTESNSG